jgi:acyl transferase domain-containing protein/NADPH:quinone reductase-like Zn-dependent oxidoreductase/NAD(P)-dependent dehydrogenase (short-subunit alcohol dehydrogenase family)/acyl carrier protein
MQSNRISHFFDLRGPSFTTDTACSSSLVALHLACQSLRTGESSMAIVGGCHLNMLPEFWISFSKSRLARPSATGGAPRLTRSRLFSDQGRSFSFDSRGTGFGRGEGCGMVILKPLDQAQRDNDSIRAIIAGSGINQDGRTPGITMPSGEAQEKLMRQVYRNNGLNVADCGFVEAHGTGTKVGDPIETRAIHEVLGQNRGPRDPLYIGSVKSNIGHLEGASGIIAVMKAALMLERGFIPANYDFKHPNEKIPFAKWNLKVPTNQRPWPRNKKYISVNNFGFGGTNAHVVVEKAPFVKRTAAHEVDPKKAFVHGRKLLVLSANDKQSLEKLMKNTVVYLEQRPEMFQIDLMNNVAYTLCQRRSLLPWRVAIPAPTSFEFIEALNSGKVTPGKETEPLRIGFIYTGQGAQWHAMGRELYEQYPVFQNAIDTADTCLAALGAEWSLVEELGKDAKDSIVGQAHISQPACTAIQLALTDLLRSWGIRPTAVAGHSSGEIAAAYSAGILTFDACMTIAYHRGRLIPVLKKRYPNLRGAMMAVGGTKEEFTPLISKLKTGEVKIACYNSPTSLTISGDEEAIGELEKVVEEKQLFNRKLVVDTAYHSHHMNLVAKDYQESIRDVEPPVETAVRFHSSLLGHRTEGSELQPSYWVQNLTCAVRFAEAVADMVQPVGEHRTGVNMLIELGPHSALQGPIKQILKAEGGNAAKIPYASVLIRKKDAVESALDLAATLFTKGAVLNFENINFPRPAMKQPMLLTDMPRYPWNYSNSYWHESRLWGKHRSRNTPRTDVLGTIANYSNDLEPTWRNIVRLDDLPWLRHHQIQSLTVFPLAGFVVMAMEAAAQKAALNEIAFDRFELKDVNVSHPLVIPDADLEMTITLRPQQEGALVDSDLWEEFRICSWTTNQGWKEHCKGLVALQAKESNEVDSAKQSENSAARLRYAVAEITAAASKTVDAADMYGSLAELGVSYGPTFQGIENCQAGNACSAANIKVADVAKEMPNGHLVSPIIHPSFLESLIEMYWPILAAGQTTLSTVYLPSSIGKISISRDIAELTKEPGSTLRAYCLGDMPLNHPKPTKVRMFATAGNSHEAVITLEDLTVAPILEHESQSDLNAYRELCYKMDWEPVLTTQNEVEGVNGDSALETKFPDATVVIVHDESQLQKAVAAGIADILEQATGKRPEFGSLFANNVAGKLCIFLSELDQSLLTSLTEDQFSALQKILTTVEGILWVVRGAYANSTSPNANMVAGLSRSIRSETLLRFATLDLDSNTNVSEEHTTNAIIEVFKAAFGSESSADTELEYMERAGSFFTPRIINDDKMNEFVHRQTKEGVLEPTKFSQEKRPLKMIVETTGALDTIHFVDDDNKISLGEDELDIEVKAVGVNHRDIMAANGKLSRAEMGFEASGVVKAVGANVTNFRVGDRVAAMTNGAFASQTRTKAAMAFKLPSDMSFESGASVPLAFSTAYYSLIEVGRLSEGESVLIHAAAGAVGQAAISLAQMVGAEVFTTVGCAVKRDFLIKEYGIPEGHIFFSRNASFGSAIRQATRGQGVDVVLNSLTGDALRESIECLNKFGRFVEIGRRDAANNTRLELTHFDNNASFISVNLFAILEERPKLMKRLLSDVAQLIRYGKIRPVSPINTFPISDVETAFKALQIGKTYGKIVVVPQANDVVQAPSQKLSNLLRPDASYVLIGGTGGLGRSMARWMINQGAKHLVLISRSGSATGKVAELIDEAKAAGVEIVVRPCDVAKKSDVDALLATGIQGLPPVRGIVHGAMVLRDVLFEKMAFEEWTSVMESKVHGAWNFHNALLNEPLDFFVVISSAAAAVGNRGQAAYAAANCFLNAFVQHRVSLGLHAASIDPTAISDTGYLAENAEAAAEVAKNLGSDSICEAEVLALLGGAINGNLANACNHHTITGMRITPSMQPFWTPDAKFKHLREAMEALAAAESSSSSASTISYNAALKAAKSPEEAQDVVCKGLVHKIAIVLMMEEDELDITRSLSNYPLDSLVAIEIRNFITREFEANMQVLELLSSGSIQTLAMAVCGKSKIVSF